jgi:hypothetical protein
MIKDEIPYSQKTFYHSLKYKSEDRSDILTPCSFHNPMVLSIISYSQCKAGLINRVICNIMILIYVYMISILFSKVIVYVQLAGCSSAFYS